MTNMGKLVRLAWRNVWRNRRRTLIAVLAIALGLALLVFFDSFLAGAKQSIYGNVVKLQGGNVQIHAPGYLERAKRLPLLPLDDSAGAVAVALTDARAVAASRRINTGGMVSSREGTFPVVVGGIEPEKEAPVGLLIDNIVQGRYLEAGDEDFILLGQALADRLEVSAGDRVTLVGRATHEQMRRRTMTVAGIYDVGLPEVEKGMVYISLLEAQTLFDLRDQATEIAVFLERVGQEPVVVAGLQTALPGYEINSWEELSPGLKQSVEANELFMDIFALVILLIAGIGILNLLLMAVFERTREIGLLAAMGLKRRETLVLFLLEGMLIGLMGALAGGLLGVALTVVVGQFGIDYSGMSEATELTALMGQRAYPRLAVDLLIGRAVTVAIIATLASLYPAWQASRREPAEALHYV
jgi:ABC-type lipoprotein release transport system permease subunit